MLSDEVRSRLALLNRGPLPADPASASMRPVNTSSAAEPASKSVQAGAASTDPTVPSPHFAVCGAFQLPLLPRTSTANVEFDAWSRGVEHDSGDGLHLRCRTPLSELWPGADSIPSQRPNGQTDRQAPSGHPELLAFTKNFPQGTLFLDLETCGFAGSMVFLVGLVWHDGDALVVDQLFARNYAEERAVLQTLWNIAARCNLLVTFNGKSFDWPMVHDRSTRHLLGRPPKSRYAAVGKRGLAPHPSDLNQTTATPAVPVPLFSTSSSGRHRETSQPAQPLGAGPLGPKQARPELLHCDLLHHARRLWRGRLPNCKLQTLERFICRRERHEDLGGAEVPAAYHRYVRDGDDRQVRSILEHNAWDLVTLVQVMVRVAGSEL